MAQEFPPSTPGAATPLDARFNQFEERYQRELADVRTISTQMQELISMTESVLDELDRPGFFLRIVWRITGYSAALQRKNFRNQLKLQQSNLLLSAAIARQNRVVIEGLRLALEKLQRVEDDARYLRQTVIGIEERRERLRLRRKALYDRVRSVWERLRAWVTGRT